MKKVVLSIFAVVLVLSALIIPAFGAPADAEWVWSQDDIDLREWSYSPGVVEIVDSTGDPTLYVEGSFTFDDTPGTSYYRVPSDVPADVDSYTLYLSGGIDNQDDSQFVNALYVAFGDTYLGIGEFVFSFTRSADDPNFALCTAIRFYNCQSGGYTTLYTDTVGWSSYHYKTFSFGHGYVYQQLGSVGSGESVYSDFFETGFISAATQDVPSGDDVGMADFTAWLATAAGGFLSFSLFGGFTIGHMLSACVAFSFVILFAKFFAGG